jgi:hypothetical protein
LGWIIKMIASLKRFDLYKKINKDVSESTATGGILSIITYTIIFLLFTHELSLYLFTSAKPTLTVEDSTSNRIKVDINIRFNSIPCALLSISYADISSEYFTKAILHKYPIDSGRVMYEVHMTHDAPLTQKGCGSCYGAELYEGQCCNTCEEVLEAYTSRNWKPPDPESVLQCRHKSNGHEDAFVGEGCLVEGEILTRKIPATIRFELNQLGRIMMTQMRQHYGGEHIVHHLGFSDPEGQVGTSPIDGFEVKEENVNIYYLKVNPAIRNGHRYYETNDGHIGFKAESFPLLAVSYDIEPITSVYKPEKTFVEFLVSVCAIIGGWQAMSLILSKIIV